ncbi:neuromedin-B isoform X1 [Malaclemys terrapin pileata]|uniref:neuromedin-B isoform X1 n=1 Tax=Malaclemys terrapin pileata TaxID=2991368 RepID=UPI0023A84BCC|nr:neuromedin-B isoform X1 [Malaclemys terrapin pileata]
MGALPASRLLGCLLLFSFFSAAPAGRADFAEPRGRTARIKVNPRGSLWATGHFMGKKSIAASPLLESPEDAAANSIPMAFSPTLRAVLQDMKELLTRELLKILLQERLIDENQGKSELQNQPLLALTHVLLELSRTGTISGLVCTRELNQR